MAEWTHRICEKDWFDTTLERDTMPPGVSETGEFRMPVRLPDREPEPCCVCGVLCVSGIYFRRHPEDLRCTGRHDPDDWHLWSQVGARPRA
jgi:hypothetical protein